MPTVDVDLDQKIDELAVVEGRNHHGKRPRPQAEPDR